MRIPRCRRSTTCWPISTKGIDGYIATPGGRVWLNYLDEEVSFQLCGAGCIHTDPNYRPCPAFPPAAEYTIESLEARADRDTGEC